ncbi:MAG: hypothetical protein WCR48_07085 [Bacteroidales bacterium]
MKKFFLFVSIVLMTAGCSPKFIINSSSAGSSYMQMDPSQSGAYNFVLGSGKKNVSGLLYGQPASDGGVRFVATTYFGMSVFDITVYPKSHKVNEIADFLNKKPYIGFIVRNLRDKLYDNYTVGYAI